MESFWIWFDFVAILPCELSQGSPDCSTAAEICNCDLAQGLRPQEGVKSRWFDANCAHSTRDWFETGLYRRFEIQEQFNDN